MRELGRRDAARDDDKQASASVVGAPRRSLPVLALFKSIALSSELHSISPPIRRRRRKNRSIVNFDSCCLAPPRMSGEIALDLTKEDGTVEQQRVATSETDLRVRFFVCFGVASRVACLSQLDDRQLVAVSDDIALWTCFRLVRVRPVSLG